MEIMIKLFQNTFDNSYVSLTIRFQHDDNCIEHLSLISSQYSLLNFLFEKLVAISFLIIFFAVNFKVYIYVHFLKVDSKAK